MRYNDYHIANTLRGFVTARNIIPLILLSILLISPSSSVSAQWKILSPVGLQGASGVHFTDQANGFALGGSSNGSWTLRTTNGGAKWNSQFWGGSLLFGLSSSDDSTIYASGQFGLCGCAVIMRSTDRGKSWGWDTTNSSFGFYDVVFPTPQVGYTGGYNNAMFKTTDNGISWESLTVGDPGDVFTRLFFVDAETGFALAGANGQFYSPGKLYKTTDGGASWLLLSDYADAGLFLDMSFTSREVGVMIGAINLEPVILRTEDGGENWTEVYTNSDKRYVYAITFADDKIGYAVGKSGLILRTTDAGKTWSEESSPTTESFSDVYALKNHVYAVAANNTLLERSEVSTVDDWEDKNESGTGEHSLSLTPTPFLQNGMLILHNLPTVEDYVFVLYDQLGREVERIENVKPGTPTTMEETGLGTGVYLYRIILDGNVVASGTIPIQ